MRYSLLFLVAVVVMSGFIAYFGDYIGRYLGKKRLTLCGLRPKHTAIISTVITGMIISITALFFLTMINSQFKQVIFHGQAILKNNEELGVQNKILNVSNQSLLKEQERLNIQKEETKKDYDKVKLDFLVAKKYYKEAVESRDAAKKSVSRLKSDIKSSRIELKKLKNRHIITQQQLLDKEKQMLVKDVELKDKLKQLDFQSQKLAEVESGLKSATEQLAKTQQALKIAQEQIKDYAFLRLSNVIVRQDDEIARGVISGNKNIEEIELDLLALLNKANETCSNAVEKYFQYDLSHVAKPRNQYVSLVFRDNETNEMYDVDIKTLVKNAANVIKSNSNIDSLVVVSSVSNLTAMDIENQPVYVEFKLHKNELVYSKGDLVAARLFDGRLMSDALIFTGIYYLFSDTVFREAIEKGIVPVQTSSLFSYNQVAAEEQVDRFLKLMQEIKSIDGMCNVSLFADTDIYSADSVTVKNTRFEAVKIK